MKRVAPPGGVVSPAMIGQRLPAQTPWTGPRGAEPAANKSPAESRRQAGANGGWSQSISCERKLPPPPAPDKTAIGSTAISDGEALIGKFQNRFRLLPGHAGKPFDKLADGCAAFEILEERPHRDARAAKQPRPACVKARGRTSG